MNDVITSLKSLAEKARIAGRREECLKIKEQIETQKQQEILSRHKKFLAFTKEKFPIGFYIPELKSKVVEHKEGCGTKEGWVHIYLFNREKPYTHWDLNKAIQKVKDNKQASEHFAK